MTRHSFKNNNFSTGTAQPNLVPQPIKTEFLPRGRKFSNTDIYHLEENFLSSIIQEKENEELPPPPPLEMPAQVVVAANDMLPPEPSYDDLLSSLKFLDEQEFYPNQEKDRKLLLQELGNKKPSAPKRPAVPAQEVFEEIPPPPSYDYEDKAQEAAAKLSNVDFCIAQLNSGNNIEIANLKPHEQQELAKKVNHLINNPDPVKGIPMNMVTVSRNLSKLGFSDQGKNVIHATLKRPSVSNKPPSRLEIIAKWNEEYPSPASPLNPKVVTKNDDGTIKKIKEIPNRDSLHKIVETSPAPIKRNSDSQIESILRRDSDSLVENFDLNEPESKTPKNLERPISNFADSEINGVSFAEQVKRFNNDRSIG